MKSSEYSPITLSLEEKRFFEKSGFLIVRGIKFYGFFKRFILLGGLLLIVSIPYSIISAIISGIIQIFIGDFQQIFGFFLYGLYLLYIAALIVLIIFYIRGKYLFLSKNGTIAFGKWYNAGEKGYLKLYDIYFRNISEYLNDIYPQLYIVLKTIGIILISSGLYLLIILLSNDIRSGLIGILYISGSILLFQIILMTLLYCIDSFASIFYPLFRFGNLGEKIQSLTPRISEQSKQIESEFRGDMDFRVLSNSFDSLASSFSQIVNLVMKLERVEQKANRGDLFDSTKYINSLREDIRTPLLSLKTFLETKKVELESSQDELSRVRVSVGGGGENRELQSIRSNELLKELDENMLKIGEMIEKL